MNNIMSSTKCKKKSDHETNRLKVCAPCGNKISSKEKRILNTTQIDLIVSHRNQEFSVENSVFPVGICNSCRIYYGKVGKDPSTAASLPAMPNYLDMVLPRPTRNNESPECNCYVCITGRDKRQIPTMKGRGVTKVPAPEISIGNGLNGSSPDNSLPNSSEGKAKRPSISICATCRLEIGKGINHTCTIASSSNNVVQQVLELPEKQRDQVVSA